MLEGIFAWMYPPVEVRPKEAVDLWHVVLVGLPSPFADLPTGDLRTLWFHCVLSLTKNVSFSLDPGGTPHLGPSHRLPYISTLGLHDGQMFDSIAGYLHALHPDTYNVKQEALVIQLAMERVLYDQLYYWIFNTPQCMEKMLEIYGRPQDRLSLMKRYHLFYQDYPQHRHPNFQLNLESIVELMEELEHRIARNVNRLIKDVDDDSLMVLSLQLACFMVMADKFGLPVHFTPAMQQFARKWMRRALPSVVLSFD